MYWYPALTDPERSCRTRSGSVYCDAPDSALVFIGETLSTLTTMTANGNGGLPSRVGGNVKLEDFAVSFPAQVEEEFAAAYGADHWEKIKRALAKPYVRRQTKRFRSRFLIFIVIA